MIKEAPRLTPCARNSVAAALQSLFGKDQTGFNQKQILFMYEFPQLPLIGWNFSMPFGYWLISGLFRESLFHHMKNYLQ
jgi:hypothetical protein